MGWFALRIEEGHCDGGGKDEAEYVSQVGAEEVWEEGHTGRLQDHSGRADGIRGDHTRGNVE